MKQPKIPLNKNQNNDKHNIIFKYSLKDHNIGLILILTVLKTILLQGSLIFSKTMYLKRIQSIIDKDWFSFHAPVGCAKFTSHVQLDSDTPIIAYQQHKKEFSVPVL